MSKFDSATVEAALEDIVSVAVSKKAGAAKKMQAIARRALFPNGSNDRG